MEALIPWTKLHTVIEPFYPKGERGRPPLGLERMLRVASTSVPSRSRRLRTARSALMAATRPLHRSCISSRRRNFRSVVASAPVTFYGPVWVDFNSPNPFQTGLFDFPYHTLALGISAVPVTGTINIKTGISHETMTITKPLTLAAVGGPVTIGH